MNVPVADSNSACTFEGVRLSCSRNDEGNKNVQKTDKKDVAEKDPPVFQKIKRVVEPGPMRRGIRISEVWPILNEGIKGETVTCDDLEAFVDSLASGAHVAAAAAGDNVQPPPKKKRCVGKGKKACGAHVVAAAAGDSVPPPPKKKRHVGKGKKASGAHIAAAAAGGGGDNVPPPPAVEEAKKGKTVRLADLPLKKRARWADLPLKKRVRWAELEAAAGGDNVPPPPGKKAKKGKTVRWADLEAGKQNVKHYSS